MTRPDNITEEHLTFLDNLRDSGVTNMLGAGDFISRRFGVDTEEAHSILRYWMDSFGNDDR